MSRLVQFALPAVTLLAACSRSAPAPGPAVDTVRSALTATVVVSVVDSDGNPKADSKVIAQDSAGSNVAIEYTDATGHATLTVDDGTYQFATPGESDYLFWSNSCDVPACAAATITVQRPVVVTVVDTDGNPQADQQVLAQRPDGGQENLTYTDDAGRATLSVAAGTYRFVAAQNNTTFSSPVDCVVPGCTTATITIQPPITVTVVDNAGNPWPNLEVVPRDLDGNYYANTTTDDQGHAILSVVPGTYHFVTVAGDVFFESAACVVPGCRTATIIVPQPVVVSVLDAEGNPIVGKQVYPQDSGGNLLNNVSTDEQGHATLFVQPGAYRFVMFVDVEMFTSGAPGSCTVPGCTSVTIQIPPPVVVTVVDGAGHPIANQEVIGREIECGATVSETTDAAGHASFSLTDGGWQFQAKCGCETFYSGEPGSCVVPGCTTARITMVCGGCTGRPDGTACNDGNACTRTDTCQGGACVGSNPVTCAAQDQCHVAGACDASTGACSNPAKADGTACNDGNSCTSGDTCQTGSCTPGTPSCGSIAVEETSGNVSAAPQMSVTLAADATAAVPGDAVGFTAVVKNTGTLVDMFPGTITIHNTGSSVFTAGGYQQTLEYFSVATHAWTPFARVAYDAGNNLVPETTMFQLAWELLGPNDGSGATFAASVPGTTIAPGGFAQWRYRLSPVLPPDIVQIIFDPAQASSLRAAIHFDVPSGVVPPAPGTADFTTALAGVTGGVIDPGVKVFFSSVFFVDPTGTALSSSDASPLSPGATRIFNGLVPAPVVPARDPSDTDSFYLAKLTSDMNAFGYDPVARTTGHAVTADPPIAGGTTHVNLRIPIVTPTKSGPASANAGLTLPYTVVLANSGNAVAGPLAITDSVDGAPVGGASVTAPATIAGGAVGTATVNAPTPLDRAAGPMTDVVAVTWHDKNGNSYGPVSSAFTTALAAGHPQGYLSISGGTDFPDLIGSTKTLTATALDPFGNPAAGVAIHLAVTGVNPQAADLTTDASGHATFSYSGASLGTDTIVASGTITTSVVTSAPVSVQWASSVGTPCTGRGTPLDVMIVIDVSPSMMDAGKIQAAKAASDAFIDDLDFTRDQVGVVLFNGGAGLFSQLTTDGATAKANKNAAIDVFIAQCAGICPGGTNFPAALDFALDELASARHRAGATPVITLLSDGGNTGADPAPELARLRASGARAISIGLGSDIDGALLRSIASSQNDYFYSPSAAELAWAYNSVNQDLCRNHQPIVSAGGNQSFYEVRLPDSLQLNGEIHDDGPPGDTRLTSEWTLVSGPAPVDFLDASAPVTRVLFTTPGTYVLQLAASDGFLTIADRATVTVDPDPSIVGANLLVALATPGPVVTGTLEAVTATLTDGLGAPIANFAVQLTVAGANPVVATAVTNASGVASFAYTGTKAGTDVIHATALGSTFQLDSSAVSLAWTAPATAGPILTQGWIASPGTQTPVMGLVPIVLAPDQTLTSGTLTYWATATPTTVHTLATGIAASPGATLATFDTTVLANGSYIIRLDGTNDAGTERISQILVTATGDYKPGRVVVELTDLTIPIAGLPITVGRRYDSLEKDNVGDFGHGWSLLIGHPKLEVDPANDVTITMPDNRRVTFYFAPHFPAVGPVVLGFFLVPAYKPEPGVFGKLTSDGCSLLSFNPSADDPTPICLDSVLDPTHLAYVPTTYTYTDQFGRQFVMAATGELKSIRDRSGNALTFQPSGIISATGRAVSFERDSEGRITKVTSPVPAPGTPPSEWDFAYDESGDLVTVTLPPSDGLVARAHHTYADHRLLTTVDPRGNPALTSTYDASGRLATDTDALRNVTSYAYDLPNHTTRTTYPDTGVVTQVFDDRGLMLSETDQLERTTTHEYDASRNETSRTNAANERTVYAYDTNGGRISTTDSVQRTTHATYNEFEQPTTFTDALGQKRTISYDQSGTVPTRLADSLGTRFTIGSSEQGLPLFIDDAVGHRAYLTYDADGNLTSRTDRLGRVTRSSYDDMGRRLTQTRARGGMTEFVYTARGQIAAARDPATAQFGFRTFSHDQNGNVTADSWPLAGHVTAYSYDALNHVTKIQYGDGTTRTYTRDFRGNKLTETDEANRTATYEYDLAGQLTKTTFPDGTTRKQGYDSLGRPSSLTDERQNTTAYEYDPGCGCPNRVTKVTDPLGRSTMTTYDAAGRLASMRDAAGRTTSFVHDARDQLIETHFPDNTSTRDVYDVLGRRISTTDQMSVTTLFGYDDQGQVISMTDGLKNVTGYGYDLDGNRVSVSDANSNVTTYEYDLAKRKTKRQLPLGMFETFAYDAVGNQTARTDFRGKTTTNLYSVRDRLLTRTPDPTLGEPRVSFSYNPTGTRASMTDASGTTLYTYDHRDRLLTKATSVGTLTYAYDPGGNLASLRSSNANGTSIDYSWDAANQLISVTDNHVSGRMSVAYTPTGHRDTMSLANGVEVAYAYDGLDRITSLVWRRGAASPFASWAYEYNERGQRTKVTDVKGRSAAYGYDIGVRLVSETITGDPRGVMGDGEVTYSLDPVGNRLARQSTLTGLDGQTFAYDANDQSSTATYDENGNTIAFGGHTFAYDFENRLISKDAGAVTVVYDGDGNKVAKSVGGVTTSYLVDDLNPTGYLQVLEVVSNGQVQTRYTFGSSIVSQTRNVSSTAATSFYGVDGHGSITFLTDSTGFVTDTYAYDAWGNVAATVGTTRNERAYAGEELDPDLGLMNLRARQYDPSVGRFTTPDPLCSRGIKPCDGHRYLYSSADPVNNTDPTGMVTAVERGIDEEQWARVEAFQAEKTRKAIEFEKTWKNIIVQEDEVPFSGTDVLAEDEAIYKNCIEAARIFPRPFRDLVQALCVGVMLIKEGSGGGE